MLTKEEKEELLGAVQYVSRRTISSYHQIIILKSILAKLGAVDGCPFCGDQKKGL